MPDLVSSLEAATLTVNSSSSTAAATTSDHIDKFRQWIDSQPHISCLTDDDFLSPFVKLSPDSHTEAQNRLQSLLTYRKQNSHWFENLDSADPKIQEVFDQGWLLLLPEKDDAGRQLYLTNVGLDPKNVDSLSWCRAVAVFLDYFFLINKADRAQCIGDFNGATLASFTSLVPMEDIPKWVEIFMSYPSHVSTAHLLNCSDSVKAIVDSVKGTMGQHLDVKVHADTLDELYKEVPMRCLPVEYLPADYTGPNAGTVRQVIEYTKATLTSSDVRDRILKLSSEQWGINESQK